MPQLLELARAKINLTLTVLGRRPDGYHEIESLVTFAGIADRVTLAPGPDCRVTATGPFAGDINGPNLLEKALAILRDLDPGLRLGAVALEKNLPVAAGLGGGSADAAALLRAVRRANPERAAAIQWHEVATRLGADVPVCLDARPALMWGIGDRLEPLDAAHRLPEMHAVLVNPRLPLSTAAVFGALAATPAPAGRGRPLAPGPFQDLASLIAHMRRCGNDLERPATALLPAIADIKARLAALPGCRLAALSGSGPTCFGIFATGEEAALAAQMLAAAMPGWWIAPTHLGAAQREKLS